MHELDKRSVSSIIALQSMVGESYASDLRFIQQCNHGDGGRVSETMKFFECVNMDKFRFNT